MRSDLYIEVQIKNIKNELNKLSLLAKELSERKDTDLLEDLRIEEQELIEFIDKNITP